MSRRREIGNARVLFGTYKLEQLPAAAAWVEHATIHSETDGVADAALVVVVWALAVRAAAATKKRDLKSMIGGLFVTGWQM
jgi:hypothetical protein